MLRQIRASMVVSQPSGFSMTPASARLTRSQHSCSLTAANAGHLAPYVNGKELAIDNGLPLGITSAAAYCNTTRHLEAGTTLTLLTDGVVEVHLREAWIVAKSSFQTVPLRGE